MGASHHAPEWMTVAHIEEHFGPARGAELFRALHDIAVALAGVLNPRLLAGVVADKARSLLRAEAVGLFAWNEAAGTLEALYADDPNARTPLLPSEGIVGRAFQLGRAVLIDDYPHSARAISWAVESGTRSAAAVPLIVDGRTIGVLAARNNRVEANLAEQAEVLTLLAAFVAPALEAARLYDESDRQARQATEHAARLAAIVEQLPSAVLVMDARGNTVLCNEAARRLARLSPDLERPVFEQIERIHWREPISRRTLRAHETPSARILMGEVIERTVLLISAGSHGADTWVAVAGAPLHDADGRNNGGVLVYTDVTHERTLARDLSAVAVEHARLLGTLAEREARLEYLVGQLAGSLNVSTANDSQASMDALSARDREIVRMVARGMTNRQIGAELHLTAGTVANRVGRILSKLGVADRTQAAVLALARGLL